MSSAANIYHESFTVRSYNVRPDGSAKLTALCNFLQEAAGNHANKLDFDIQSLRQQNQTWILHRLQLDIQRYPHWGDTVEIETWPSAGEGLVAYRDFILFDQAKNPLAHGISQWVIMDLEKGRPIRMPEEVLALGVDERDHALEPRRDKIDYLENKDEEDSVRLKIRRNDIDVNGHVNNVSYIGWITESVPNEIYQHRRLNYLDIIFHRESNIGDEINSKSIRTSDDSFRFTHQISRNRDQESLSTACTSWNHISDEDSP